MTVRPVLAVPPLGVGLFERIPDVIPETWNKKLAPPQYYSFPITAWKRVRNRTTQEAPFRHRMLTTRQKTTLKMILSLSKVVREASIWKATCPGSLLSPVPRLP